MKVKLKFHKKWLLGVGILTLLTGTALKYEDDFFEISKNLEIFTNLYRDINVYYVDETQPGSLIKTGIDAMLASLDPYTVYIPESKIEDYRFMTTGQYGGIGATIQQIEDKIYITEPYEGFPAQKAGLKAGDEILKIDGKEIAGRSSEEVSGFLKGQSGTDLEIQYLPFGGKDTKTITLSRETVKVKDVPYHGMLDDETGYIKLTSFTETASKEVREAFQALKKEGMEQLVFDLRGNGGGLLREAVNIVNFFVPKGEMVVDTRGKLEEMNQTHFTLNQPLDMEIPVVVLVDNFSASASEIVSGALQDMDRAVIVGRTTFGKGLVQNTTNLSYNSKLKLTVAKYYIPSGRCIQKLDYSNRNETGDVEEVPDSLLKAFQTKSGRKVIDGRGIEPDVHVIDEEFGRVLGGLWQKALFFKYANAYALNHEKIQDAYEFSLTEEDFEAFKQMALQDSIEYETASEKLLQQFQEVTQKEKYLEDIQQQYDEIKIKLKKDVGRDMEKYKSQILQVLENEIVSRYYYQKGRVEASLANDQYIDSALTYLEPEKYSEVLGL